MNAYLFLLLPLSLVAVPSPADAPRASMSTPIVRTYPLASLTRAQAERLRGKRARFGIVLDSSEWEHDGYVSYDCRTDDMTHKTVTLFAGEEVADEMEVEARLVILHHRGWMAKDGTVFHAFTEYRLMDARRCR